MNLRQFIKVKKLRRSLDRIVGTSFEQQDKKSHVISAVTPSTPLPLPPVIRERVPVWTKVSNTSLVAFGLSAVALVSVVSYSNPPKLQEAVEAITNTVSKLLIAAATFGLCISTFSKRKGMWLFVFSSFSAVGIFAFSAYLFTAIVQSRRARISDQAWAANAGAGLDKFISQAQQGSLGDGAPIAKTGNQENDELSNAMNKFMTDVGNLVVGMRGELEALQPKQIFDDAIIRDAEVLDAESQKRVQSLQIIERYRKKIDDIPENSRVAFAAMKVSDEDREGAIKGLTAVWQKQQPKLNQLFDLLKAQQQTELDYLRFMAAWSGSYHAHDNKITFSNSDAAEQYNVRTKSIAAASAALNIFRAERQKETQEDKKKLLQIGK